jgi:hypothetical protein
MMAGKEELRRQGGWASGLHTLPLGVGYDRATRKFSYTPDSARVKRLYRKFLSGVHNYDLLSREAQVSRGTVRNLLTNPIYSGWLVYDERRDDRRKYKTVNGRHGDRPKVARPESDVIRVKVLTSPLIKQSDWDQVQRIIKRNTAAHVRARVRSGQFTYAGFLVCAKCGRNLHSQWNTKNHYYLCSGKKLRDAEGHPLCSGVGYTNREKLEPALDRVVTDVLASPARLRKVVAAYRRSLEEVSTSSADRTRMEEQLKKLTAKRDSYIEMYSDGTLSRADRDVKLTDVDKRLRALEAELRVAQPVLPAWTAAELSSVLEPLRQWSVLTRKQRRMLLNALHPTFRVRGTQVISVELAGSVMNSLPPAAGTATCAGREKLSPPDRDL